MLSFVKTTNFSANCSAFPSRSPRSHLRVQLPGGELNLQNKASNSPHWRIHSLGQLKVKILTWFCSQLLSIEHQSLEEQSSNPDCNSGNSIALLHFQHSFPFNCNWRTTTRIVVAHVIVDSTYQMLCKLKSEITFDNFVSFLSKTWKSPN